MPGNVASPNPTAVFPNVRIASFSESRVYPVLASPYYHGGECDRSMIEDGVNLPESVRQYTFIVRDTPANVIALKAFFESTDCFYWYHPYEPAPLSDIGSNYDGTGASIVGRHTCVFRMDGWAEVSSNPARSEVPVVIQEIGASA